MSLGKILFPLLALAVALVAFEMSNDAKQADQSRAAVPENSPDVDNPSLGNLVSALGIALGSGNSIGRNNDTRLVTDPEKTRRQSFYGFEIRHPGMAGANNEVYLLQSALANAPLQKQIERPASVIAIPQSDGCAVPAISAGQKPAKVQVFSAEMESGYHALTDDDLISGAREFLKDLQQSKDPANEGPSSRTDGVPVVQVVVTDESAPLYLVLQASTGPVVWNLSATPGVEIAQIVLVGQPGQAVHPLKAETPVTMLSMGVDCAPQPWPDTTTYWQINPNHSTDTGNYSEKSIEQFERYNTWFTDTFGFRSDTGMFGAWTTNQVLVGPMPKSADARAVYRPLAGATIIAQEGPVLYVTPRGEREADVAARRYALALSALGGDLSIANPTPMERAQ
ncbi:MAG: hypothetical protein AAGO57_01745 [Pseudomonadota bacterium]